MCSTIIYQEATAIFGEYPLLTSPGGIPIVALRMNRHIRFPRQLEADGSAETIRQALWAHTVKLWPGGDLEVPLLAISAPLTSVLYQARRTDQLRCGLEQIAERLQREKKGIEHLQTCADGAQGDRLSRLLLFTNDGAERFYRHIEKLLQINAARVLGCRLDIDAETLGKTVTGKERHIKIVMAEHKDAVCEILRALIADHDRS